MSKAPLEEEKDLKLDNEQADSEASLSPKEQKKAERKKRREEKNKTRKSKKPKKEETEEERKEREKEEEKRKRNKPKDIKEATKRLLKYFARYKALLVIVAILVVATTVISVLTSLAMMPIYEALENALKSQISGSEAMQQIIRWLLIMAGGYTLSALCNLIYTRIMLHVSSRTMANMRRDLFNHLQGLPLQYFDKRRTGEIMSRFTSDVNRVSSLLSEYFPTLISSTIQAVMTITIMIIFSWKLTLTITVAIILMFAVVFFITSKCSPLFKQQQKAIAEVNGFSEEYIRGIKVVKLFCHEEKTKAAFNELNENYRKVGVKANIISGFMSPMMSMIMRVNYAIVVLLGAVLVINGEMTIATLITYLDKAKSYASPIASLASCYSSLVSALAGAERVFEVLDTPNETDEGKVTLVRLVRNALGETEETDGEQGELAWKVPTEQGAEYVPLKGNIEVEDVTFSYVEGTDVLKHINVSAKSGQKVAFVGSTGAGKTTITNLINRFYEIDRGEITYDGIPIQDIKKADLRHSMAMVLQDTKLFAGTIADNIRYGKLDATDEEVIAAAKIANAHSFIEKMPDGYQTEIRADAVNISTGQAQLINIARAAIAGAPLLILDEATSSVDTRTERHIELGMDKIMEDRTVFVIAHRLSTVRNSQDIVVLENGEIIEEGDHQTLIDKGGKYYQLYTGTFEMT
ncbi:MAG: ABC transporter ATP-binding protein [Oscillospiraceae bacterium]|nr:ABC transporter ATP-binding protein [Oscillospiraceae bacterium]